MIVVDTNVISEPMRPKPNEDIVRWLNRQPAETLYLTTINIAELRLGVASLPKGKKRSGLAHGIEKRLLPLFASRVLPFNLQATAAYAELMASAKHSGITISASDGLIAAIALSTNMKVATRDTAAFEAAGVNVINPWATEFG